MFSETESDLPSVSLPALIPDGFTRRSRINGIPNSCGPISFTWRPIPAGLKGEYADWMGRMIRKPSSQERKNMVTNQCLATIVSKHIIEWDQDLPPSVENLFRLHDSQFRRLYRILFFQEDVPDEELGGLDMESSLQLAMTQKDRNGDPLPEEVALVKNL